MKKSIKTVVWFLLFARFFSAAALGEDYDEQAAREIGEIAFISGTVVITHSFSSGDDHVQIGSKIYAGDIVKSSDKSAIEITFGVNVRTRLEGAGELRIIDVNETHSTVNEVALSTRVYDFLLISGVMRTRVKENVVSNQQVAVRAGDVRFLLPRSDFVLSRAPGQSTQRKMLRGVQSWGRVEIQLHGQGGAVKAGDTAVNHQPGELLIAERPEDAVAPQWRPLAYDEAREICEKLVKFSVDVPPELPRDATDDTAEMQGA